MVRYRCPAAALLGVYGSIAGCISDPGSNPSGDEASDFSAEVVARIELEETAEAPLGEIGEFTVASNGDLLVADRLIPRVRRYDSGGRLLAEFGAFGDGPFEFRRVGGVLEDEAGRIVAIDPGRSRVTMLTGDLAPDTSFRLSPTPAGWALRLPGGYLMKTHPGRRMSGFSLMSAQWRPIWSLPSPMPPSAAANPYWGGYATLELAASSEVIVAAYSFLYPIHLYDHGGEATGTLGELPPSFSPAPVLKRGALTGPGAAERRERWLSSFSVIADLSVVADTLLVVTHGSLRPVGSSGRVVREDHAADLYHLASRVKIGEDISLPPGIRVLAGGPRGLYAVSRGPPDPWTISLLEFKRMGGR